MKGYGIRDLTTGNPLKLILVFALPFVMGYFFQQLNGVMEAIIVGRYLGENSLAAVGIGGTIYTIVTYAVMGLTSGLAIIVTQQFGTRQEDTLKKSVAGLFVLSAVFAVILTIIMMFVGMPSLKLVNTPPEILEEAYRYTMVQYSGIITCVLYYMMIYLFGAFGNGGAPLCLMVSSMVVTITVDLILVGGLKFGLEGTAWGNVIGQGVVGLVSFFYAIHKYPMLRLKRKDFVLDKSLFQKQLVLAVVMACQMMMAGIGNFVVQGSLNLLGAAKASSYTAFSRVTGLFQQPAMALGVAISNYCGQNLGAGRMDRVKEGVKITTCIGVVACAASVLIMLMFGRQISAVFLTEQKETIIADSILGLQICCIFFFFVYGMHIYKNVLFGLGYKSLPFAAGVLEITARVVSALILPSFIGYAGICYAFSAPWALSCIPLVVGYYMVAYKKSTG